MEHPIEGWKQSLDVSISHPMDRATAQDGLFVSAEDREYRWFLLNNFQFCWETKIFIEQTIIFHALSKRLMISEEL